MRDPRVKKAAADFVPLFVDTLQDLTLTRRFGEQVGSYPVLRVIDLAGKDRAPRINGNLSAGRISVAQILAQLSLARQEQRKSSPERSGLR